MGNAIVTVFGYQPLKARFTPSYKSRFYYLQMSEQELLEGRYFDEAAAFYDMKARNAKIFATRRNGGTSGGNGGGIKEQIAEKRRKAAMVEKAQKIAAKALYGFVSEQESSDMFLVIQSGDYDRAIKLLQEIKERANGDPERSAAIQDAIDRLDEMKRGEIRLETK